MSYGDYAKHKQCICIGMCICFCMCICIGFEFRACLARLRIPQNQKCCTSRCAAHLESHRQPMAYGNGNCDSSMSIVKGVPAVCAIAKKFKLLSGIGKVLSSVPHSFPDATL